MKGKGPYPISNHNYANELTQARDAQKLLQKSLDTAQASLKVKSKEATKLASVNRKLTKENKQLTKKVDELQKIRDVCDFFLPCLF